ncbi:hypothetical protein D2V93_01060 [Flagellimonas taeanensis]|jgi:hypothetical protein|uniref:Uncharacterized protein n=1 Tax=Flagellimonas taeanensis TaxID=1005926 RepID=A0A1M7BS91_9FLAO|nr:MULTISPECIES: hypothetical protein [Allomuricauda]MDC6384861.1 hypothetical protein [Muricauda sp. SK9]RIV53414.1 hypothetical protein D2V93_01060 [Allomuricauda taeanensis]SFC48903.1 hypothetical protein SAMN04487891_11240 [Allomuricauda taeanensis]SHL57814.1 hypothetical protein SAMN05216293_3784 [Allomuricauda taeanensis]
MELDNIEKLMEKYFEATTTVAEERTLREYFAQDSVAPHLEQYRPMFNYFSSAKEERYTKQVPLKPRVNYYKWLSVAAAVVLTFGLYFGKQYQDRKQQELEQAEYAYQETKKAFELLAENFGRGTEKVAYLKEFEEAKQKIYNNN